MNRAETQTAFKRFLDRLACATVADEELAKAYVDALASYLATLAADWQAVDIWSVEEYEQVCADRGHRPGSGLTFRHELIRRRIFPTAQTKIHIDERVSDCQT